MSTSRSIWIVTDYGGEYEDHWETVVRAFSTEEEAMKCLEKRVKRQPMGMFGYDYCSSDVQEITLVEKDES